VNEDRKTPDSIEVPAGGNVADVPASPQPPPFFTDFIELLYGIIATPVATLRNVAQRPRPPIGPSLLIYLVVIFVNVLAGGASLLQVWRAFLEGFAQNAGGLPVPIDAMPSGVGLVLGVAFFALLWAPVSLFFKTGALNLMGVFFGGRGDGRKLLAAFGLTYAPTLVSVPVGLLLGNRPSLSGLAVAVTLGILVWRLILDIIAIREVHGLDTGRAAGAALVPLGVFLGLAVIFGAAWVSIFASLFAGGL
jgi:hypothetical protein